MSKRFHAGLILLVLPIVFLLLTLIREKTESVEIRFSLPSGESGTIVLGIPEGIWIGDPYTIRATVTFDSKPAIPVILVGRLETSVEEIDPRGEIRLGMDSKNPVTFEWLVVGYQASIYPGTLWLWIETDEGHQLLMAREFTIPARDLFGIRLMNYRIAAGLIALAGLMALIYSSFRGKEQGGHRIIH